MRALILFLTAAALAALAPATALAAPHANKGKHRGGGAVYTQTNDPAGNQIVVYKRASNGSLTERDRVATGGLGEGATPPFGFPITDSQGSVELTKNGRLLFAVNAGDNSITSFRVRKHGGLVFVEKIASGGALPVSLDSQGDLLYVVNETSGNITGFRFKPGGDLTPIPGSTESLSTSGPGGVAGQIGFAPRQYRTITVTLRQTQQIDTFKLGSDDTPGPAHANPATDVTPFGFAYRRSGQAIVSNAGVLGDPFDLTKFQGRAASYSLATNGTLTPIDSVPGGGRATCWVVITSNQRYTFMTNTLSQSAPGSVGSGTGGVSRFRISSDGHLTLLGTADTGAGFPSDEALSRGSRYLYVLLPSVILAPLQSHIDIYRVRPGGSLTHIGATPNNLPPGVSGLAAR